MSSQTFNANAGFHVANTGIDRTISSSEEICAEEKERIRTANAPTITLLECRHGMLMREQRGLLEALDAVPHVAPPHAAWPVWQTIMATVFVLAGLGFTRMSFEPFALNPELLWLSSVGIACLCSYATAELLERTGLQVLVLAISATLFVLSLTGLAMLASVRGDLFALHLQNIPNATGDGGATAGDNALAFYRAAAPKMELFLILLSIALELAAGLALHQVRVAVKGRKPPAPRESGRLELVEQEIGDIEAQLISLLNEPEAFEHEYRRNLAIGLLCGVARHTATARKGWMTVALLVVVGSGAMLRSQSIDMVEALDYSATSKATNYGGTAAHTANIDAAVRIIECLPQGSQLTVSAISDQSFARPFVLLAGKIPNTPGPYREYDQIVAARNRLAASLRKIAASTAPNFPSTDILGFLLAAGTAFQNAPHMRHVLVIHSDMRQSAKPLDIEHVAVVPVSAALATVARERLFADLTGVEIYIYGVHAVGKDVRYWRSLCEFWTAYFERCHANLRAFSMTRENPDLGGSR